MKLGSKQSRYLRKLAQGPITLSYSSPEYLVLASLVNRGLADLDYSRVDLRNRMVPTFTIRESGRAWLGSL